MVLLQRKSTVRGAPVDNHLQTVKNALCALLAALVTRPADWLLIPLSA